MFSLYLSLYLPFVSCYIYGSNLSLSLYHYSTLCLALSLSVYLRISLSSFSHFLSDNLSLSPFLCVGPILDLILPIYLSSFLLSPYYFSIFIALSLLSSSHCSSYPSLLLSFNLILLRSDCLNYTQKGNILLCSSIKLLFLISIYPLVQTNIYSLQSPLLFKATASKRDSLHRLF